MRRFVRGERFWQIGVDGACVVTRYGVIGGKPREERKFCKHPALARKLHDERLRERLGEGGWAEDVAPTGPAPLVRGIVGLEGAAPVARSAEPLAREDLARATLQKELYGVFRGVLQDPAMSAGLPAPLDERWVNVARLGDLDPTDRALLLSVAPSKWAAELVVARYGLAGLVEAVLTGQWVRKDGLRWTVGPHTRPDVPRWLWHGRVLGRAVADADLAAARALVTSALDAETWRVVDAAFLVPEVTLPSAIVGRVPPSVDALWHLAAALDPEGWLALDRLRGTREEPWVRPWLATLVARFEHAAVPVLDRWWPSDKLLGAIHHPDAARALIRRLGRKPDRDAAQAALRAMAPWALITLATDGASTPAARELARELAARQDLSDSIDGELDAAGRKRLSGWTTGESLPEVGLPPSLPTAPTRPTPTWLLLPKLPPLTTASGDAVLSAVARAAVVSHLEDPPRGLASALTPLALSRFTLALVEQWAAGGAPEAGRWTLRAAADAGDRDTAQGLARLARAWARDQRWAAAELAVDALAAVHDTAAFVQLGSLARSAPRGVKRRAELHLRALASQLGLDEASLEEVLLPDLGLDERGTMDLDFGPRRFVVGFDGALEPFVLDEEGARLASLPRPRQTDDPAKAKAASAAWSGLKKDARLVATTLVRRVEDGLRRRRRWEARQLQWLAEHPFARHVVRRLVWSSGAGLLRFDEEGLPVDASDAPVALEGVVTVPHPVDLAPDAVSTWARIFADYEVVQPFEQLARPVHRVTSATGRRLTELEGLPLPRGHVFALEARGWRVGWERDDAGRPTGLANHLQWAGVDVELSPTAEGYTLVAVRGPAPWEAVDPLVTSEVIRDLRPQAAS